MTGLWLLTLRQSVMSFLWATLACCCLGVFLGAVFGLILRRSPPWWLAAALMTCALVLSVVIACLDQLGFGGRIH
jgi:NhaP-type Na+/H+ or K+/H+ antiporter